MESWHCQVLGQLLMAKIKEQTLNYGESSMSGPCQPFFSFPPYSLFSYNDIYPNLKARYLFSGNFIETLFLL